jgi:putative colanic acid biosynthesis UDP-glucose lipid carrier transferase
MLHLIREKFSRFFPVLFTLGEIFVISFVYFFSAFLVDDFIGLTKSNIFNFCFSSAIWIVFSVLNKNYRMERTLSYAQTLRKTVRVLIITGFIISLILLFRKNNFINREFLITWVLLFFISLPTYSLVVRFILQKYRAGGGNIQTAAIIGYDEYSFELYDLFLRKPEYGIRCRDIFSIEKSTKKEKRYPLTGNVKDFFQSKISVFDVIYINGEIEKNKLNELIEFADQYAQKVKILPHFKSDLLKNYFFTNYDTIPVVDVQNIPLDNPLNQLVKRSFDVVFSLFMIVFVLSWLYPLLALIIKAQSKGPVIFKQKREGKNGTHFTCFKFRSMILNDESDQKWATLNDPRLTKVGSFLRKTSLDEFPQFLNVLIGDMSIVGPRPHAVLMNDSYRNSVEKFAQRHSAKPGVTGLSQTRGLRGEISEFHDITSRVKLDRFYLSKWNFILDLNIIAQTIYVLIKGDEKAF